MGKRLSEDRAAGVGKEGKRNTGERVLMITYSWSFVPPLQQSTVRVLPVNNLY